MSSEERAIKRLQDLALQAAKALGPTGIPDLPPSAHVLLVCTRDRIPQGERFRLIANMKSPLGKLANVKPNGDRFDCCGYFPALDVLAFAMAKLDELGGECPVQIALAAQQTETERKTDG